MGNIFGIRRPQARYSNWPAPVAKVFFDTHLQRGMVGQPTSLVRELHVYGSAVPVHARDPRKFQHQGYGTLLMEEAEKIARNEHGSTKISVISGVGTRDYYRRLGYWLDGKYSLRKISRFRS